MAGEHLLDSYSDERVAAARENLRQGTKSTEFMAPPSFAYATMRTAVLGLAERHPEVRPLMDPDERDQLCRFAAERAGRSRRAVRCRSGAGYRDARMPADVTRDA